METTWAGTAGWEGAVAQQRVPGPPHLCTAELVFVKS